MADLRAVKVLPPVL